MISFWMITGNDGEDSSDATNFVRFPVATAKQKTSDLDDTGQSLFDIVLREILKNCNR